MYINAFIWESGKMVLMKLFAEQEKISDIENRLADTWGKERVGQIESRIDKCPLPHVN